MKVSLPSSWKTQLADEFKQPYFKELSEFVDAERERYTVYPPEEDVFNAFKAAPFEDVKVLLLGQDPYHGPGQAHGLCFSVLPHVKRLPPSLVNIYKELHDDVGVAVPRHGYLAHWAEQGVLMLNTVLTVRAGAPMSHRNKGWETFTNAVIRKVGEKRSPVVFVLWGGPAQKKIGLIDTRRHIAVKSAHPSPLSAHRGFLGSRPFSKINVALRKAGKPEIDWKIPDLEQ
jgi:uracil-DNA glycosylase